MLHLLMQPWKKLKLHLKTGNTQKHQKIELYGSPTTKDLKKPHSSRLVGGAESQRFCEDTVAAAEQSHIHVWWIEIGQDTLGVSNPSPRPDCTAQAGFQCQEDKSL